MSALDGQARINEFVDEQLEVWLKSFDEAILDSSKTYSHRVRCECGRTHDEPVTYPDLSARQKALQFMLERRFGRAGVQVAEQGVGALLGKPVEELSADDRRRVLEAARDAANRRGARQEAAK